MRNCLKSSDFEVNIVLCCKNYDANSPPRTKTLLPVLIIEIITSLQIFKHTTKIQ